jgi:zinc transporter 5/7
MSLLIQNRLVSVEIVFDAIHRLNEGYELTRLNELLIVSILGFLVNMIGLTAFGHAHHGHSHGHSHDHSHDHSHTHSQNHSHNHSLNHSHSHSHNHSDSSNSNAHFSDNHSHKHSHDNIELSNPNTPALFGPPHSAPPTPFPVVDLHSHTNENMEGIFLHILADALGSVAVIISTLLTKYNSWSGWDPLASCMIAILIFFSAIPLVKSSGLKLLLALSDEAEYRCRGVLQGISELMGIVGYAGVRFWMADQDVGTHHHHKTHEHEHEDKHDHHDHVEKQFARATILGVIHIIASKTADLDDVRDRTDQYLRSRGFDVLVHVETQGEGRCWCGGGIRQAI